MGTERARKQVFVRANLRLQHKDYTKRAFIAWNPDSVESDGGLDSGAESGDDGSIQGEEYDSDFDFNELGEEDEGTAVV